MNEGMIWAAAMLTDMSGRVLTSLVTIADLAFIVWIATTSKDGTCGLLACIQCNEDKSDLLLKQFAGRIQRSSGILT